MKEDPIEDRALIIFIKNPQPGKVKTRLAKSVGNSRAMEIYQQLLRHTREVARTTSSTRFLFYSDWIEDSDEWSTEFFHKNLQHPGDLGDRMKAAFTKSLSNHGKAVIIGSDCAQLTSERLTEAFNTLDKFDVVIGPTMDGGYYLLGIKALHYALFENMPWSSGQELMTTIQKSVSRGLSVCLLPELSDIDYIEDWVKFGLKVQ